MWNVIFGLGLDVGAGVGRGLIIVRLRQASVKTENLDDEFFELLDFTAS